MSKRKANGQDKVPSTKMDIDDGNSSGDDDASILNVDFEWFDPDPEIDFHGLKTLLRQLFDVDNELLDLSALSDLILTAPTLGSTVKCDGKESDPYAFLTVLNLRQHRDTPVVKALIDYLIARAQTSAELSTLSELLSPQSTAQVGLVLSERFINMPHQIVPPLYKMTLDEIAEASKEDQQKYNFTHYLIISKTYTEVASQLDAEPDRPAKKTKKGGAGAAAQTETFYFHPEDEVLHKHALGFASFDYSKQGDEGASDAKRAFQELGVRPQGHLILMEGGKIKGAVKAVEEYLGGEA